MAKKNKKTELGLLTKKQEKQLQDMVNGMLREGTLVRIDHISSKSNNNLRVKDDLGKIWYLNKEDING